MHKKGYNLHTSRNFVFPVYMSPSCLQTQTVVCKESRRVLKNLWHVNNSNQFESLISWLNFLKLVVAAQNYDILHSSLFLEIPGGSFNMISRFDPCPSINFLFQNTQ